MTRKMTFYEAIKLDTGKLKLELYHYFMLQGCIASQNLS